MSKPLYLSAWNKPGINFIGDIVNNGGKVHSIEELKIDMCLILIY